MVPTLYPHQVGVQQDTRPFHLLRWGRRAGKTIYGFTRAVEGGGPIGSDGTPLFRGLRHGGDVLWVGRSYDQARIIWRQEVKPRFEAAGGKCNDTLRTAQLPGFGILRVCSQDADSINNARGDGKNVVGVIGDEVAHWDDAEGVWLEILLPMLTDNMGWAAFLSTTKPGSWFNKQCQRIDDGETTPEWAHFYATAEDNPRIAPEAFRRMVGEYPVDDVRLDQEVYAKLTAGGAGYAFPEYSLDVHGATLRVPDRWEITAGMAWGYAKPGTFILVAHGPDRRAHICHEFDFAGRTGRQVGTSIARLLLSTGMAPQYIAFAEEKPDPKRVTTPTTIMAEVQAGIMETLPHFRVPIVPIFTKDGRKHVVNHLHELFHFAPDDQGMAKPGGEPKLTIDPVLCPLVHRGFRELPRIEDKPEEIDLGEDMAPWFLAVQACFQARTPIIEEQPQDIPADHHPGFIPGTFQRRDRHRTPEVERKERLIELEARGGLARRRYVR